MLRAALGNLALQSSQELASRISAEGSADPANYEMRDAALHLAILCRVTGNDAAVHPLLISNMPAYIKQPFIVRLDGPRGLRLGAGFVRRQLRELADPD